MLKVNEVLRPEGLDKLLNRKQILEFDIKSLSSEVLGQFPAIYH